VTGLAGQAEALAGHLAAWAARDDTRPDAPARRAASAALDTADAMLAELHQIRARLIAEIRDATAARVDARPWSPLTPTEPEAVTELRRRAYSAAHPDVFILHHPGQDWTALRHGKIVATGIWEADLLDALDAGQAG
jgi:hypothetical protein